MSAADPYPRCTVPVLDSRMAFIDTGEGPPVVFLHGNPTSSYLWRNVIPEVERAGARCLAPDLIGMGQSGPQPEGDYSFAAHARYLDAWFEAAGVGRDAILVLHDWGGALGIDWARRHPDRVRAIAYMEAVVAPMTWSDLPEAARPIFEGFRSAAGEEMVLEKNLFVERVLPASILRSLTAEEHAAYRAPFAEPGESRRPTLTWPRQIPLDGAPAQVEAVVAANEAFMAASGLPKLFVNADPGMILTGRLREKVRNWPNQRETTVAGLHFVQEDSPDAIGAALADFVRQVAGGR